MKYDNKKIEPLWLAGGEAVDAKTAANVLKQAKLNWKVELSPIECGGIVRPEHKGIIRTKDNAMFGIVKEGVLMQNDEAFEFFDAVVAAGYAKYVAAGECGSGKIVWLMAKIVLPEHKIGDEKIELYCVLSNSFDGKSGRRLALLPYRTVAKSTATITDGLGCLPVRLCHTRDFDFNPEAFIAEAQSKYDAVVKKYASMARIKLDDNKVGAYFMKAIYPSQTYTPGYMRKAVDLMSLYEGGLGADNKVASGTLWGAYGTIIGWVDHYRGNVSNDGRLESAWFNQGKLVKERALGLALSEV